MKAVFADTSYWIAIINPRDSWAQEARDAKAKLGPAILVTTDEVLSEFLSAFSRSGPRIRELATQSVRAILANPNVKVLPQSRESFVKGLNLYEQRQDKDYSLTDCASMNAMRSQRIEQVLTHDHHFEQEGFEILLKKNN